MWKEAEKELWFLGHHKNCLGSIQQIVADPSNTKLHSASSNGIVHKYSEFEMKQKSGEQVASLGDSNSSYCFSILIC